MLTLEIEKWHIEGADKRIGSRSLIHYIELCRGHDENGERIMIVYKTLYMNSSRTSSRHRKEKN